MRLGFFYPPTRGRHQEPASRGRRIMGGTNGRWPTNVVLSPGMAAILDGQSGNRPGAVSNGSKTSEGMNGTGTFKIHAREQKPGYADQGGASRFFVQAGYEPWELEWILDNGLRPCGMEEA